MKLRAAWGEAGNLTALPTYSDLTTFESNNINSQNTLTASTRQGNDDLKPETKVEVEFGFEASLFNRISVEYTYYKQRVTDLLLDRELSPSTGFSTRFDNVGNLQNEGMELLIKLHAIKSKDFNWNLAVNYGRNRNEVSNIPGTIFLPDSFGIGRAAVIEGKPTGVFFGNYYARDANGQILLNAQRLPFIEAINGVGVNKIIGDPNPDWLGSLINEIQYKNFSFRCQLDAVQGFDVINWDRRAINSTAVGSGGFINGQELLGIIPKGTGQAQRPIIEEFVEDGSFVKLREVSLTYNFKPKTLGIDDVKLSLIGRNLYSWDSYKGWDPEVNSAGQRNGFRGYIAGAIPIAKTFQFGVNISF